MRRFGGEDFGPIAQTRQSPPGGERGVGESQSAREEIRQAKQIAPVAFADLPRGAADAAQFFRAQEGNSTEKLFWSQYLAPEHPTPLNDQLKQLMELHRVASLAMKDLVVQLWPAEPIPSSFFGLVKRLVDALPQIDAVKCSACIEGARMAFTYVKMHWAKMMATDVATAGPPEGKDQRKPER
nr:uncharacterized protein LOC120968825 [Aegilops tauschii subsp. strangulata]